MPAATPTHADHSGTFVIGLVAAIALVVWLLPGKYVVGLTPRQQQLKEALDQVLKPIGASTENLACKAGQRTPIYFECVVGGISTSTIATPFQVQGWRPVPPFNRETHSYATHSMVASISPDALEGKSRVVIYNVTN